jgi:hypothetical protein
MYSSFICKRLEVSYPSQNANAVNVDRAACREAKERQSINR